LSEPLQVWRCDLDRELASPDVLDDQERARAARFAFEHLRRRYVAAHAFVRTVLGAALSREPQSLVFDTSEHGKPFLEQDALAFNLSHADSIAYLVVGGTAPIGIDVELHHRIDDLMGVARTVFSTSEMAVLERAGEDERDTLFLRCWTRKEAYVKALGVGLGARLTDITVLPSCEDVVVPASEGVSDSSFHVRSIEASVAEYVAIATAGIPHAVLLRDFHLP